MKMSDEVPTKVGQLIREHREAKGLSVRGLAAAAKPRTDKPLASRCSRISCPTLVGTSSDIFISPGHGPILPDFRGVGAALFSKYWAKSARFFGKSSGGGWGGRAAVCD